jgi:rhodanese-related sulfurtransferase
MGKTIMMVCCMLGMVLGTKAQGADSDYAKMLKSLYKGTVPTVTPSGLAFMQGDKLPPILLDTRTPSEYNVSHIAGATLVDYGKFNEKVAKKWDREKVIVVYCTVGYRSERIGEQLKKLGFTKVYNLYGGIFEWVNEGYEVTGTDGKQTSKVHAYSEEWGKWLLKGEKVYR